MTKFFKKGVVFVCTLLMTTVTTFATPEYHKQYDRLETKYMDGAWKTYVDGNSPTGISIKIGKSNLWDNETVLQRVYETHLNNTIGLSQEFGYKGLDGKFIGFTGESFTINEIRFFKTTNDIHKGILPTTKYISPVTYTSKYLPNLESYVLDMNDAQKIVEGYAKDNKIANYYYKSMDSMRYDGEYVDGIRSGFGKMYNLDGDLIYIGMWKNGVFDGYGITFYDGEASYIGEWSNGLPNGMGVLKKKPSSKYYGESYFYIDNSNNVRWMSITAKYKSKSKYESIANMAIPFKGNKNLYTIADLDEDKLISICNNYDDFKIWSKQKSEEIVDFNTNPPY